MSVPKHRPLPVYDPASGENPFAWIVKTAAQVREGRASDDVQAERRLREFERKQRQKAQP